MIKILINMGWGLISQTMGRGGAIIAGLIIATLSGPQAFAAFSYFHLTGGLLSVVAMMGFANSLSRYYSRLEVDPSAETINQIVIVFLATLAGMFLVSIFLLWVPHEVMQIKKPITRTQIIFLVWSVVLNILSVAARNGMEHFSAVAKATILQGCVLLSAAALAGLMGNINIALWGYIIANTASIISIGPLVSKRTIKKLYNRSRTIQRHDASAVLDYCGPVFISSLFFTSGVWLSGRLLLKNGTDNLEFAQFSMGFQWFSFALIIPAVANRIAAPKITRMGFLGTLKDRENPILISITLSIASSLLFMIPVVFLKDQISAWYGQGMESSGAVIVWFVGAAFLASPINAIGSAMIAAQKQKLWLLLGAFWWLVLSLTVILNLDNGALGVGRAFFITYTLHLPITLLCAFRSEIFPDFRAHKKAGNEA